MVMTEKDDLNNFWIKKTNISYMLAVLVLIGHCTTLSNYMPLSDSMAWFKFVFKYMITRVPVPLFLIISGAVFFRDYNYENYCKKVKSRIKSLLIPYLLWNTINMGFDIIGTSFFSRFYIGRQLFDFSITSILEGIFHYKYNPTFWFIFALIIFSILAPLINVILKNKHIGMIFIFAILLLSEKGIGLPAPIFFNQTCIVYYLIGAFIGKYYWSWFVRNNGRKRSICLLMMIPSYLYLIILEVNKISEHNIIMVPLLVLCAYGTWAIYDTFECGKHEIKFMNHSFWVYALHMNTSTVITKLLYLVLPKTELFALINLFVSILVTLVLIELICYFAEKYMPKMALLLSGDRG